MHLLESIDDESADAFVKLMKAKLKYEREVKGKQGWFLCSEDALKEMLSAHILKGDMVDVANIAMMIHFVRLKK